MTLNLKHIKILCRNPAWHTLDESGGHYNKWNKPYGKEQILYDVWFHLHEASRIIKLMEAGNRMLTVSG